MIFEIFLQNFRNYKFRQFEFSNSVNFIIGENGTGKTNLLEALSLCFVQNGIRGAENAEMNYKNSISFLLGFETKFGKIGIENKASGKIITLDGEPFKLSNLSKKVQIVDLMPEDEFIFSVSPSKRRDFFDKIITKIKPFHGEALKKFKNLCLERIKLLSGNGEEKWLNVLESQIAEQMVLIATTRVIICEELSLFMQTFYGALKGKIVLSGFLETKIINKNFIATVEEALLKDMLKSSRKIDSITGKTITKFERVNFDVLFENKKVLASRASSGEQKRMVFSLLLATVKKLLQDNFEVIIFIDEVISKLDLKGRNEIITELTNFKVQSFLTGTEDIPFENINKIIL